jgi:hypothetical protein
MAMPPAMWSKVGTKGRLSIAGCFFGVAQLVLDSMLLKSSLAAVAFFFMQCGCV